MELIKKHEYWEQQDIKPFLADIDRDGLVISPEKYFKKWAVQEPTPLPEGYEWTTIDMKSPDELEIVYELLKNNFCEDEKALLRFNYSKEMIEWVTCTTQYN